MNTGTEATAAGTEYTMTAAAPVTLGRTTYSVEVQTFHNGSTMTWLTGPRGGVFFLRGYSDDSTGLAQVISWKSGKPLAVRGNEVEVVAIGDVIEVVTR